MDPESMGGRGSGGAENYNEGIDVRVNLGVRRTLGFGLMALDWRVKRIHRKSDGGGPGVSRPWQED